MSSCQDLSLPLLAGIYSPCWLPGLGPKCHRRWGPAARCAEASKGARLLGRKAGVVSGACSGLGVDGRRPRVQGPRRHPRQPVGRRGREGLRADQQFQLWVFLKLVLGSGLCRLDCFKYPDFIFRPGWACFHFRRGQVSELRQPMSRLRSGHHISPMSSCPRGFSCL